LIVQTKERNAKESCSAQLYTIGIRAPFAGQTVAQSFEFAMYTNTIRANLHALRFVDKLKSAGRRPMAGKKRMRI